MRHAPQGAMIAAATATAAAIIAALIGSIQIRGCQVSCGCRPTSLEAPAVQAAHWDSQVVRQLITNVHDAQQRRELSMPRTDFRNVEQGVAAVAAATVRAQRRYQAPPPPPRRPRHSFS